MAEPDTTEHDATEHDATEYDKAQANPNTPDGEELTDEQLDEASGGAINPDYLEWIGAESTDLEPLTPPKTP